MIERLTGDQLTVAFVAEFSRGKSELINSIFFADYGSRILPSSAGRTTMCPTELLYDASRPPSIDLLPIAHPRPAAPRSAELKRFPDEWTRIALDIESTDSMSAALKRVGDVTHVSRSEAERLGFVIDLDRRGRPQAGCRGQCRNTVLAPCADQLPAPAAGEGAGDSRHAGPQRDRRRTGADAVAAAECPCGAVHSRRRYRRHPLRLGSVAPARHRRAQRAARPDGRAQQDRRTVGRPALRIRDRPGNHAPGP